MQVSPGPNDKLFVSRFAEQARELFDSAQSAAAATDATSNTAILISSEGSLHLVSDSDWPLDSLALHHGAATAFRVTAHHGTILVEGREGSRRCMLESDSPARTARLPARRTLAGFLERQRDPAPVLVDRADLVIHHPELLRGLAD